MPVYQWAKTRGRSISSWSRAPLLWHIVETIEEQVESWEGKMRDRKRTRRLCHPRASDDWFHFEVWNLARHEGDPARHPLGFDVTKLERPCAKCLSKLGPDEDIYAVQPEQPLKEDQLGHLHDEAVKNLRHIAYGRYADEGRSHFDTVDVRQIRANLDAIRDTDPDKAADLDRLASDFVSALGLILGNPEREPEREPEDDDDWGDEDDEDADG